MTVLITGGSGFLGSYVAERLASQGVDCRALVRGTSDTRFLTSLPNVTLVRGDLADVETLRPALRGVDGVIHVAGLVKARRSVDFHRTNVVGTDNLMRAVASETPNVRRVVVVSSLAAAGPSVDGVPVSRGSVAPVTRYGRSKAAAETVAREASNRLPITILRPAAIYGPRDREILAFFRAVKWGILPLTSSLDARLSMVYGADCASACVAALGADVESGSIWYVEDGETRTFAELITSIETAMERRAWLRVPIPSPILWWAAMVTEVFGAVARRPVMFNRDKLNELGASHWVCSAVQTRTAIGWEPCVTFAQGAIQTAAWYHEAGWL